MVVRRNSDGVNISGGWSALGLNTSEVNILRENVATIQDIYVH
jgi:hypothetical protein